MNPKSGSTLDLNVRPIWRPTPTISGPRHHAPLCRILGTRVSPSTEQYHLQREPGWQDREGVDVVIEGIGHAVLYIGKQIHDELLKSFNSIDEALERLRLQVKVIEQDKPNPMKLPDHKRPHQKTYGPPQRAFAKRGRQR